MRTTRARLFDHWAREADQLFERIAEGDFDGPLEAFEELQALHERVPDNLDDLKSRIARWMVEVSKWVDHEFLDDDIAEFYDDDVA